MKQIRHSHDLKKDLVWIRYMTHSHIKTLEGKTLFPWPSNRCSPYDTFVVLTVTAFEAHVEDCILSLHHLLLWVHNLSALHNNLSQLKWQFKLQQQHQHQEIINLPLFWICTTSLFDSPGNLPTWITRQVPRIGEAILCLFPPLILSSANHVNHIKEKLETTFILKGRAHLVVLQLITGILR